MLQIRPVNPAHSEGAALFPGGWMQAARNSPRGEQQIPRWMRCWDAPHDIIFHGHPPARRHSSVSASLLQASVQNSQRKWDTARPALPRPGKRKWSWTWRPPLPSRRDLLAMLPCPFRLILKNETFGFCHKPKTQEKRGEKSP